MANYLTIVFPFLNTQATLWFWIPRPSMTPWEPSLQAVLYSIGCRYSYLPQRICSNWTEFLCRFSQVTQRIFITTLISREILWLGDRSNCTHLNFWFWFSCRQLGFCLLMNPFWPNAQPWDNLLFALAAVFIVVLNRHTMFKKGTGVTEVLMPEETPVSEN